MWSEYFLEEGFMEGKTCVKARLCVCALAVAFGVAEGVFMLVLALVAWHWGTGLQFVEHVGSVLHGYTATPVGSVVGLGYGFVEGAVFGVVVGVVYNVVSCCCCRKKTEA